MPKSNLLNIATLPSARSLSIADPHRYYVKAPAAPGVQPALIVITPHRRQPSFLDALVVLPADSPLVDPVDDPLASACLQVVAKDYRALLSRAGREAYVKEWSRRAWTEPPFTALVNSQSREHAYGLLRALHTPDLDPSGGDLEHLIELLKQRAFWSPPHLSEGQSRTISPRHWSIFARWEQWEERQWDWLKRYEDLVSGNSQQWPADAAKGKEQMRKLCDWMGLSNIRSQVGVGERIIRRMQRRAGK